MDNCRKLIGEVMAHFAVGVNERAFHQVGVDVVFDHDRYSELLDALVESELQDPPLEVRIGPANRYGQSADIRAAMASLANEHHNFTNSSYNPETRQISMVLDGDPEAANRSLLRSTRDWAGVLSGESAAAAKERRLIKTAAKGGLFATTILGAVAGNELVGDAGGILVGGIFGFMGGVGITVVEATKAPYRKELDTFSSDPDVLAQYGDIIRFERARRAHSS